MEYFNSTFRIPGETFLRRIESSDLIATITYIKKFAMARNEGWMNRAIQRKREKIDFSKLNRSRVLFNLFGLWGTMRIHFDRPSVESEAELVNRRSNLLRHEVCLLERRLVFMTRKRDSAIPGGATIHPRS